MKKSLFYYENSDERIISTAAACDDFNVNPTNLSRYPIIHAAFGKNDKFIYVYFEVIAKNSEYLSDYIIEFAASIAIKYPLNKFIFKEPYKDEFFFIMKQGHGTIAVPFVG